MYVDLDLCLFHDDAIVNATSVPCQSFSYNSGTEN